MTSLDQLLQQGREALMRLDRDEAAAAFGQVVEEDPHQVDGLAGLGQVAYERADLTEAAQHFAKALKEAEQQLGGWPSKLDFATPLHRAALRAIHGAGLVAYRQNHPDQAKRWFEKELQLDPQDHQGVHFLLKRLASGKDWKGQ